MAKASGSTRKKSQARLNALAGYLKSAFETAPPSDRISLMQTARENLGNRTFNAVMRRLGKK